MKRRNVRMTDNSVVTSDLWYRYDMGWNALASYDLGTDGGTAWDIGTRAQSSALRQLHSHIWKFGNERDSAHGSVVSWGTGRRILQR